MNKRYYDVPQREGADPIREYCRRKQYEQQQLFDSRVTGYLATISIVALVVLAIWATITGKW